MFVAVMQLNVLFISGAGRERMRLELNMERQR